jgi:DNA segregation ATPase FtsK/SpoIIIE, S-DNA-T family
MGVYQPRTRRGAMTDALDDARRAIARVLRIAMLRGAGATLCLASVAAFVALASYHHADPSLNNATGLEPSNLLGGPGAAAADLLLECLGFAAIAFLAPPAVWGARALRGRGLSYALWRAFAWPVGTVLVAAGLGVLPSPIALPAKTGGWIGIAAAGLSHMWRNDPAWRGSASHCRFCC